uniref:Uncharacterized protein n=1 Tax=Photinus pyralis TaxID=7054 RepID=A0A1Y1K2L2_PHOPY
MHLTLFLVAFLLRTEQIAGAFTHSITPSAMTDLSKHILKHILVGTKKPPSDQSSGRSEESTHKSQNNPDLTPSTLINVTHLYLENLLALLENSFSNNDPYSEALILTADNLFPTSS